MLSKCSKGRNAFRGESFLQERISIKWIALVRRVHVTCIEWCIDYYDVFCFCCFDLKQFRESQRGFSELLSRFISFSGMAEFDENLRMCLQIEFVHHLELCAEDQASLKSRARFHWTDVQKSQLILLVWRYICVCNCCFIIYVTWATSLVWLSRQLEEMLLYVWLLLMSLYLYTTTPNKIGLNRTDL